MPKEVIYGKSFPYSEKDPAGSITEVRWSRDSEFVQIATRCINISDETVYKDPNKPTLTAADGWFVDLDRNAINKLIKDLRKARDQAYGKDE